MIETQISGAGQTAGTPAPVTTALVTGAYDPDRQITIAGGAPLALERSERTPFETKMGNEIWMDTER